MSTNPLLKLEALGQSIWLDDIQRSMLRDGSLAALIAADGLSGQTSNPAIFEKAITHSDAYDADIGSLTRQGLSAMEIFETLAIRDVRDAADLFRPVHEKSQGRDGFVSLEISPRLAYETEPSIGEARRLWQVLKRPNVMIKVPATAAGIPVVRTLIEEGVNVNVTLLFSLDRYREAAEAYISGLEARVAAGAPVDGAASVASFFLSRIDTLVDTRLDALENAGAAKLRGEAAVSSARLAYQVYREVFAGPRWEALAAKGARPQRLLWASTSTKDPSYSPVKYVDALIGADTVNTLPMTTLEAYRREGQPRRRLEQGIKRAQTVLDTLPTLGIEPAEVAEQLEREGVQKFVVPYDKLLATLERRRAVSGV